MSDAYCFGPFRLDPVSGLLFRGNRPVALTPKVFDALVYLAERSGRLVTKDELMQALWSDAVVSESNLTQTIFMVRKVLADGENGERYISTVPGRGYRFDAEVRRIARNGHESRMVRNPTGTGKSGPAMGIEGLPPSATAFPEPKEQSRRSSAVLRLAAIAMLFVAVIASFVAWRRSQHRPTNADQRIMLAVLPFQNLTGDTSQDYFSDGLTEEMLTQLSNLDPGHMGVIARTSIMRYKNTQPTLQSVANELGVDYVLEGSVRRDTGKVRITAQLIQTRDQTHLWAREYDRDLSSLLTVQSEIAEKVADEIQLTLGEQRRGDRTAQQALSPDAVEAYDLYLRGRYLWNKRTPEAFEQATGYFQQSLAKQPNYAKAYAGLADTYALMSNYGFALPTEVIPKARAAALKALELDPGLAEAHSSLALIAESYDWDRKAAEKEYLRAIQLNPNYATGHQWYAEFLSFQGRFEEALAESERARQLDPLSQIIAADRGATLYYSRQYDRAIDQFRAVLDVEPAAARAHLIHLAYAQKGQFAEALRGIDQWPGPGTAPWPWALKAYVYGCTGQLAQARQALRKLVQANRQWHQDPAPMYAIAYSGMGQKDEALTWLEKAYTQHSAVVLALKVDPVYDPLRSDPRFKTLMHRIGYE